MNKHAVLTHITPLPSYVTREAIVTLLHDHSTMITANPLVTHHGRCTPPPHALPDEQNSTWYEITDRIEYVPGTSFAGSVTYTACMHDIPNGLQTHIHAPMGMEIRGKWQVLGWIPGEERTAIEIGTEEYGIPKEGLYLREDCNLKCNFMLWPIVKKSIKKAHKVLVERLIDRTAHLMPQQQPTQEHTPSDFERTPVTMTLSSRPSMSSIESRPASRQTPDRQTPEPIHETTNEYSPSGNTRRQFDERLHQVTLECQANGYSVSISGGTQENARSYGGHRSSSRPSLDQHPAFRGRSQSPSRRWFPETSVYKRYLSDEMLRHRAGSPTSMPSTRYASPARSSSRNTHYASSLTSRQGTPEPGVLPPLY